MDKFYLVDLKQIPFVRLLLPYILGVVFGFYWPVLINTIIVITVALIVVFGLLCLLLRSHKSFFLNLGILINLVLLVMGIISFRQVSNHPVFPENKTEYTGILSSRPEIRNNKTRCVCQLVSYKSENRQFKTRDKILIYVNDSSYFNNANVGDSVCFIGKLQSVSAKGNPGEFDYSRYLAIERIKYITYVNVQELILGGKSEKFVLRRIASLLQQLIHESLVQYSFRGGELAIISALVTGSRELLDNDIKSDYQAAGATHILAVSGMHVGILYLFLGLILKDRSKRWSYRVFRICIILFAIWAYAFLTGLTSSVIRASIMFSLFLLGKGINRSTNSFNILAASALLITLINPYELFKVGFLLSYFAVFGILFFQPRLTRLLEFNNLIIDRVWQLIALSIAAQLATLPLCLYFFHQFPVYFLLTNLVIIPIVWLIMIGSIIFFFVLPFPALASIVSFILQILIRFMNQIVEWVSDLPYSVIINIRFDQIHLIYASIILIVSVIFIQFERSKRLISIIGVAVVSYIGLDLFFYSIDEKKQELLIYNLPDKRELSIVIGHNHLFLSDSIGLKYPLNDSKYPYYWKSRQINKHIHWLSIDSIKNGSTIKGNRIELKRYNGDIFIQTNNYCICLLNNTSLSGNKKPNSSIRNSVQDVLISDKSGFPASSNIHYLIPERLIIAGKMPYKQYKSWLNFAALQNIQVINLNKSGTLHIMLSSSLSPN